MDNFRVIYRILRYLEKALDYDEPNMDCISAKALKLSDQRWMALMEMLSRRATSTAFLCRGPWMAASLSPARRRVSR